MKGNLLLLTLFAKDKYEFGRNLVELLKSKDFGKFTVWELDNNTICKSIAGTEGITSAIFDIYDLGYNGNQVFEGEINLRYYDKSYPVYASVFCSEDGIKYAVIITFHNPVNEEKLRWLRALAPYMASRINTLDAGQRQLEIFVDYQKKIDFIKESGQILKSLSLNEVIINALNFFADAFHAEAACVTDKNGFIVGMGLTEDDLKRTVFINGAPLIEYLKTHTDTVYITEGFHSDKFYIVNILLVQEAFSGTTFIMFNISGDVLPDKELSVLITHIVSVAIENARFHSRETALKIEQAEMQQTVEIINKFVKREMALPGYPTGYCVNYPAKSTGGDYSTVINTDTYVFTCLADVCGKGYAAATLTVMLATIIDSAYILFDNIGKLTNDINRYILEKNFDDRFITGFLCIFDRREMSLEYVSCGHEPVYLIRGSEIIELTSRNLPMGIMDEEYEIKKFAIEPGDLMFIYSDGVIEYISYDGLKEKLMEIRDMPAKDMLEKLYDDLVPDPSQQRDDFTCTVVKF